MSKIWLITGSSRGLGRALTEAVLAAGDRVVATARKPEQLDDLVEQYGEQVRAIASSTSRRLPFRCSGSGGPGTFCSSRRSVGGLVGRRGWGPIRPRSSPSKGSRRC